jgi:glycosyltransferase involved in cell wall biosynthesis
MESLKILLFNWRCWLNPEMGGAEVFTYEVLKRWAAEGHNVTLFTSKFHGCKEEEFIDGVRIVRQGGKFSVYWKAKSFYRNHARKEGFNIVIDEINTRPFFTPNFVDDGEQLYALIHQLAREYWFYETPFPVNYIGYHILENRWLRNYVNVPTVTVSESTRRDLLSLGFKRVHVVPEGLNFKPLDRIPKKEDRPIVVYAGRLKRAKRPDHAIKAFKLVKEQVSDAELWVIGDGYFRKSLEKTAGEGVKFWGSLPDKNRRELLERAWVLVNPSVREGFGLNVIEANALGTPCLVYNVPGLRDAVINGETGFIVNSGDIRGLAKKIIEIITDDRLRLGLSEKALAYSSRFSWDRVADEFMNIIKNVGENGV